MYFSLHPPKFIPILHPSSFVLTGMIRVRSPYLEFLSFFLHDLFFSVPFWLKCRTFNKTETFFCRTNFQNFVLIPLFYVEKNLQIYMSLRRIMNQLRFPTMQLVHIRQYCYFI